ncbi:HAD hydrolase family protein [Halorarius halobius]|uniref:HAD hydrolase family protein n=1 Tax=Halorarius halobius TaxID=2962671 RepID=UPI0020CC0377|nr:HAD hydrolase family protein [Halorarius halobius]
MVRPLAVDVDGTLTRPKPDRGVDPRVFEALRAYSEEAPVVVATGKAFPYPVALCEFVGLPIRVVAENGGVVCIEQGDGDDPYGGGRFGDGVVYNGDREAADAVARAYEAEGHALGWGAVDLVNRWRETEIAVARDQPLAPLERVAAAHGQEVVDTGYAYHVKSPDVDKDIGLETAADRLGYGPGDFLAVGDSENDAEMFGVAGESWAVANADDAALSAADFVTDAAYADGFLEALERATE